MPLNDTEWGRLQAAFATGSPIIVLGPGCHRIGYDDPSGKWPEVVDRMRMVWTGRGCDKHRKFLRQLWVSKLTEETRRRTGVTLLPEHDIEQERDVPPEQRVRTALAIALLDALVACTESLGKVIAGGRTPVSDWLDVSLPSSSSRSRPAKTVAAASALAAALASTERDSAQRAEALRSHGLGDGDLDRDELRLMKIDEISGSLATFHQRCFVDHNVSLSGALVEWMSDVLWHIVISGSGVPPSQDELAFYVNLAKDAVVTERGFNRPRPGDYRRPDPHGRSLTDDIRALLDRSEPSLVKVDWNRPRERFAAMIAASLVATWRHQQHAEGGGKSKGNPRLAIALVSDYDVLLERAIIQALGVNQHFHVVAPVWVDRDSGRTMEWLIGTFKHAERRIKESDVLVPDSWHWFATHDGFRGEPKKAVAGPIIVKLSGSPLHLRSTYVPSQLKLDQREGYDDAMLAAATIFSEHDSMEAMLSFAETAQKGATLANQLFDPAVGLGWQKRAWLFFGHRFSDWLPRLRLFFAANQMGRPRTAPRQGQGAIERIAVDRGFDHPELALLKALAIEPFVEDLRQVTDYPKTPRSSDTQIVAFCDEVCACLEERFTTRSMP